MSNPTDKADAKPPVVLRYIGPQSPYGHVLPPAGVPARDLTQADIDELPVLIKRGELQEDGTRPVIENRRMTIEDVLAYFPPAFERAALQWESIANPVEAAPVDVETPPPPVTSVAMPSNTNDLMLRSPRKKGKD